MAKGDIRLSPKHGLNPSMIQCPTCEGDAGLVMQGYLPDDEEAPKYITDWKPCEKCLQKYKDEGYVAIVGMDGRKQPTGSLVVLKKEAALRMFNLFKEISEIPEMMYGDHEAVLQIIELGKGAK